ncbi:hypothetical protein Mapa_014079 [Marchantia paleacea]|nr:hypothetical protein Mapa_014079 [Marchantia paleacea]
MDQNRAIAANGVLKKVDDAAAAAAAASATHGSLSRSRFQAAGVSEEELLTSRSCLQTSLQGLVSCLLYFALPHETNAVPYECNSMRRRSRDSFTFFEMPPHKCGSIKMNLMN